MGELSEIAELRWNGASELVVAEDPENATTKECEHTTGDKETKRNEMK